MRAEEELVRRSRSAQLKETYYSTYGMNRAVLRRVTHGIRLFGEMNGNRFSSDLPPRYAAHFLLHGTMR